MKQLTREEKYLLACDRPLLTPDTINRLSAYIINRLSAYTISRLSADTINSLSAYTISRLSIDTINSLSADTISRLSADTISRLPADTISRLSADTINSLSPYTISRLSAYTISSLSADTISRLSADTINRLSENEAWKEFWKKVPVVEKPYSRMLADINKKIRIHKQSTFGTIESLDDFNASKNSCGTPMCTAGQLVNMGGEEAYKLVKIYGFSTTAAMIHSKSCPGRPCQNFGDIPQDHALAYIETEAEFELQNK